MLDLMRDHLANFTYFDYFVLAVNLIALVFSRRIVATIPSRPSNSSGQSRVWILRILTLLIFAMYGFGFFATDFLRRISQTTIILLGSYLITHVLHVVMLVRFGRVRKVDDQELRSESYQSEIFSVIGALIVIIIAFVSFLNVWELNSLLKTTSALGVLAVILFSTREVWVSDSINGLILLYDDSIQPGSVIRCDALNLLAVIVRIAPLQTTLRDLRQRHQISIPNNQLRNRKLEVLSEVPSTGLTLFIDFNIAYGLESKRIEDFLHAVWERACEAESIINQESSPRVAIVANGDHAVTWRLFFNIKNAYRLLAAEFAINRAAYDLSLEQGIGLNTPQTHLLEQTRIPPIFQDRESEGAADPVADGEPS